MTWNPITFFTFIFFRLDLVKYLHCAKLYKAAAPRPLPMSKAPLLNVNCRSSHFLITLILNDVLWAPPNAFPFIPQMVWRSTQLYCTHICRMMRKKENFCLMISCVMRTWDVRQWTICRKTVKSLFHSAECINRVQNGHVRKCGCRMILLNFSKDTAHFVTYTVCAKCNGQHH